MQPTTMDRWPDAGPLPASPPLAMSAGPSLRVTLLAALGAAALSVLMMRGMFAAVWQTGAFFDTDDAMRLVQVRALLHGQAWFDMTATGMDPPHGIFLHWSRIVDLPVAALIKVFGLFTPEATAERLARLAFPFALLVGLYLAIARLATVLIGPVAALPAIAATLLSGNGTSQFIPGRIDHHAPQIVILATMLGLAVAALDPAKARINVIAGALAAVSLAISLENLPFILCLSTMIVAIWAWAGVPMRRMLLAYLFGLGLALPLLFAATVAPSRYALPVCDAFGAAHLGAGLIGVIACTIAVFATAPVESRALRFGGVGVAGIAALAFVVVAYPTCLHDPFAAVDPLVRDIWLANVQEALPFVRLLHQDPQTAWTSILPVAFGLVSCIAATAVSEGRARLRFAVVTGLVAAGLALAFWQVRVFTSITAIALCGGVYVAVGLRDWCLRTGRASLASLSFVLVFPFTAAGVGLVVPGDAEPAEVPAATSTAKTKTPETKTSETKTVTSDECLAPAAFAPLAALDGTVVAPVDAGSYLLAHTNLQVFSAAYHRNSDGIRFVFDMMAAPSDQARSLAATRHPTFVMVCPGLTETKLLAKRNPNGLAADLLAGRTPGWLEAVPVAGTPYRVFRVHS